MSTPYKMYHPVQEVTSMDTHGQCWHGETVDEGIEICPYQLIETVFRKYLPRNGRVLEAGCGLGRWVFYLQRLGYEIIGIDLAADALRVVREYDKNAPVRSDDILHTSFHDKHFDAVISLGVVEHFEEGPQEALGEAWRLLKDDGLLFVSVPVQNVSRKLFANPLKEFKRWLRKHRGAQYTFEEYRYTRGQFTERLHAANFEVVQIVPDDYRAPKNMGLYVDYPFLRHSTNKWELNGAGKMLSAALFSLSPWLVCAGALWVCRKKIP